MNPNMVMRKLTGIIMFVFPLCVFHMDGEKLEMHKNISL